MNRIGEILIQKGNIAVKNSAAAPSFLLCSGKIECFLHVYLQNRKTNKAANKTHATSNICFK